MTAKTRARRTSPLYLPSAFDLFRPSRDLVMKHFEVFGPLLALPLVFWIHSWIWVPAGNGHWWSRFSDANYSWTLPSAYSVAFIGFSILWLIVTVAGGTLVQIMLQRAQLDAAEGHSPIYSRSWQVAKELGWRMFGLYIIIVLASVFTLGYLLRRYIFAPYVMIEKKCGIREALAGSTHISNANPGAVWGLIGVLFLINLLGILPLIGSLASFIIGSLYTVAPAIRYHQLKKLS